MLEGAPPVKSTIKMRAIMLTAVAGLTLSVAACGSDEPTDTGNAGSTTEETEATTESETTDAAEPVAENFGPGCADVPADGDGSFAGMADDPVATAASANPLLSTLVTAVTAADLVDTLNTLPEATVFAPANTAFDAFAPADLDALIADVPMLSSVLTYHVLPMRLSPDELAGTYVTANGAMLTIEGSGEDFTVGDGGATVVCGNVQTANATVYIIDQVLMPPAA
ncbi:MAG: fasciclin domain-containing protein [Geodermatophilaceae bacterium]|nr:fasciclin domain-containing protein [Geodermatophilaceae bacterium]